MPGKEIEPTQKIEVEGMFDVLIGPDEEIDDEIAKEILGVYGISSSDLVSKLKSRVEEDARRLKSEGKSIPAPMQNALMDIQATLEKERDELCQIGIDPEPLIALVEHSDKSPAKDVSQVPSDIEREILELFRLGQEEFFEDGIETKFSSGLTLLFETHGEIVINALTRTILYTDVNEEIIGEALRWLGRLDHPPSYQNRLRLLEQCLYTSSSRIRDAAALALAYLDDPHAIPYLQEAIQREQCAELREDMEQVLAQLETTQQCHSS